MISEAEKVVKNLAAYDFELNLKCTGFEWKKHKFTQKSKLNSNSS